MLRASTAAAWAAVLIVAACDSAPDDRKRCFWGDDDLRDALVPANGSGIYGTLTVTKCGAHCPEKIEPFCPELSPSAGSTGPRITATPVDGDGIGVNTVHGAYSLALPPADYKVCVEGGFDCVSITVAPGGYQRIDGDGIASPGGWAWTLSVRRRAR